MTEQQLTTEQARAEFVTGWQGKVKAFYEAHVAMKQTKAAFHTAVMDPATTPAQLSALGMAYSEAESIELAAWARVNVPIEWMDTYIRTELDPAYNGL